MKRKAFTKVELITLIAITGFLLGISMPALEKQREDARTILCASQMSRWGQLLFLYAADNRDEIPYVVGFDDYLTPNQQGYFWFDELGIYITDKTLAPGDNYAAQSPNFYLKFRQCPTSIPNNTVLVGTYLTTGSAHTAPFVYQVNPYGVEHYPPTRIRHILHPGSVFGLLDTARYRLFTPMDSYFKFAKDLDGDGIIDSCSNAYTIYDEAYCNGARPKMHSDGTNLWMFDGHIEYIKFVDFWASQDGYPTHPFWQYEQK